MAVKMRRMKKILGTALAAVLLAGCTAAPPADRA